MISAGNWTCQLENDMLSDMKRMNELFPDILYRSISSYTLEKSNFQGIKKIVRDIGLSNNRFHFVSGNICESNLKTIKFDLLVFRSSNYCCWTVVISAIN